MDLAEQFMNLFKGLERAYGRYTIKGKNATSDKIEGQATTIQEPVTKMLWKDHLEGIDGVGIIPIRDDGGCYFGAIDIDVYKGDHIRQVVGDIKKHGLPLISCRSKSGGLHCFCFLKEPAPAGKLREKLESFATLLGFSHSEVYPKQAEILADRGDIGGWLNMPYFDMSKTQRYGLKQDLSQMTAQEFLTEATRSSLTLKEFNMFNVKQVSDISDGPPCLQYLISRSFTHGTRNIGLFNIAIYLKRAKPGEWESLLDEYNVKYFDPPVSVKEIESIVKSVGSKEYQYGCDKSPMKDRCDSQICRTRIYGVGDVAKLPIMSNLTKFNTIPPIWFLNVEGSGRLELTTEELQMQTKFQRRCMESLNIMPPTVKIPTWNKVIQELMKSVIFIDVPSESSPIGILFEHLEKFCTSHISAKNKDEILLGRPWEQDGHHYFRLMDFIDYLERKRFKEFKVNKISSILKERGCTHVFEKIKGKGLNLWKIKSFSKQVEKFDKPKIGGEDVF